MRTTIFKCERCKAEDTTNNIDIINVGVHVGGYTRQFSFGAADKPKVAYDQEWCLKCRIETGLKEKPERSTLTQTPITLEDLVRDIAYEVASEAIINSR